MSNDHPYKLGYIDGRHRTKEEYYHRVEEWTKQLSELEKRCGNLVDENKMLQSMLDKLNDFIKRMADWDNEVPESQIVAMYEYMVYEARSWSVK